MRVVRGEGLVLADSAAPAWVSAADYSALIVH